jgi:catechol-2,3-dioxygenase
MNLQGVLMNVNDLDKSIDFYCAVPGFTLLSQKDQLAALTAPGTDRTELIVLRALGRTSPAGGARHVGLRAFMLDVDSVDNLERIAKGLESRGSLVDRRNHTDWMAVIGHDPDRTTVVAACSLHTKQIGDDEWKSLDEILYSIGEW